jgi:formamidopyrimidine-DNA glycosylase
MIELPEAVTLATQLDKTVKGRRVATVVANHSPHKWAWFHGDPQTYDKRLSGRCVTGATAHGGMVQLDFGLHLLVYAEGVSVRFHQDDSKLPKKHQLLVTFDDGTSLCSTVSMYGGLWCWEAKAVENPYYQQACEKPSPLAEAFDGKYFNSIAGAPDVQAKSAKALLATEQRFPGLGNGVVQDILFAAGIHPRRKVNTCGTAERRKLHRAIRRVLADMVKRGGRDTEKDLFGQPGGYVTKLSRLTVGEACPKCGTVIQKQNYLGGSVYFCETCQPLEQ